MNKAQKYLVQAQQLEELVQKIGSRGSPEVILRIAQVYRLKGNVRVRKLEEDRHLTLD